MQMKILKKNLKFILKFLIIKFLDKFVPKKGILKKNGFFIFKNHLQKENLDNEAAHLYNEIIESKTIKKLKKSTTSSKVIYFNDILEIRPKLIKFLTPEIVSEIKSYLGKNIKLDTAFIALYFTKVSLKNHISSGSFHHDSVGNRCKLFLPINPSGNLNTPTIYVSGTNRKSWKLKEHDSNNKQNERLEKIAREKYFDQHHPIRASFGDVYLFDTNGIHRGSYNKFEEIRCIIQLEFSNYKSVLRGEVGPGTFYMNHESYNYLKDLNLVRVNRVRNFDNVFIHHGLRHRRSFDELKLHI